MERWKCKDTFNLPISLITIITNFFVSIADCLFVYISHLYVWKGKKPATQVGVLTCLPVLESHKRKWKETCKSQGRSQNWLKYWRKRKRTSNTSAMFYSYLSLKYYQSTCLLYLHVFIFKRVIIKLINVSSMPNIYVYIM